MTSDEYYANEVYGGDPDSRSDDNGGYKDHSVYGED
jgi:hypothetical protein